MPDLCSFVHVYINWWTTEIPALTFSVSVTSRIYYSVLESESRISGQNDVPSDETISLEIFNFSDSSQDFSTNKSSIKKMG